jgi:hypothetical protein
MFSRSKTWKLVSFVLTVGLIYFATMYLYDKPVIGHLYPAFIVLVVLQGYNWLTERRIDALVELLEVEGLWKKNQGTEG